MDLFEQVEVGSTLAYTTSSQTSPRNVTENVGQLTCTDGGTACSAGGSDYQYEATVASHGVTDVRSLPWSASGWFKLASGSDVDAEIKIARDADTDVTTATCRINSSTWTRCQVAKLFGSSSQADNSEATWYFRPKTTVAVYMFGAQLERGDMRSQYQENNATLATGSTSTSVASWANEVRIGGTMQNPPVLFTGSAATIGTSADYLATFSNGPSGINKYEDKHFEWNTEWMWPSVVQTAQNGVTYEIYSSEGSGTGNGFASVSGTSGRIGITSATTGTTSTGRTSMVTNPDAITFSDGNYVFEATIAVPTLSTSSEEFSMRVGMYDNYSTNTADGCYFAYDRGAVMTNPTTGDTSMPNVDKWKIWCASNSTRTGYVLDGTASEDSFTTVDSAIVAGTYYRLKVQMEGTSKARFWINSTEVGRITTNIPNGATRQSGAGFSIIKSVGSAARTVNVDQTRLDATLTSVRSP